jgi:hypothetical protein
MAAHRDMPLVQLAEPGLHHMGHAVTCDYCAEPAVWYHWADRCVARDAFACNEHVGKLNRHYGPGRTFGPPKESDMAYRTA